MIKFYNRNTGYQDTNNTFKLFFLLVLIGLTMNNGCIDKVAFDHVDDKDGENYLNGMGADCISSPGHERISVSEATIKWVWSNEACELFDPDINVNIYRYQSNLLDAVYNIPLMQIDTISFCYSGDDSLIVWGWNDSNLVIETNYEYTIKVSNSAGEAEAKDTITTKYDHVFLPANTSNIITKQDYSDTSIFCHWDGPFDPIHNTRKIVWKDSTNSLIAFQILDTTYCILSNPAVQIGDSTTLEFYYGYFKSGSIDTIWQNNPTKISFTMQFDPVNDLLAVPFQKNLNRITWRYDSDKVRPNEFVIESGENEDLVINDSLIYAQEILGKRYFVYYDYSDNTSPITYNIVPRTTINNGSIETSTCAEYPYILSSENVSDYTYVDHDSINNRNVLYICNYEMSIAEFIELFNYNISDTNFFKENYYNHDDKIKINRDDGTLYSMSAGEYPIGFISWVLADTIVQIKRGGFKLPTNREWELAARAGSYDSRQYAWGNDEPNVSSNCNYNSTGSIEIISLEPGRVNINWRNQIRGPYHMCGNVLEWTKDTASHRTDAYITKGGAWFDYSSSSVSINNQAIYPETEQIGGIRLVWTQN